MVKKETIKPIAEYFTAKEISRIKVIIFLVGILVAIFMQTSLFGDLSEIWKVIIIAIMFGTSILFKVDFYSSKEIGKKIYTIYTDKTKTWYQKGLEFGNLGMDLLHVSGDMFQIGLDEQFPEKEPEVIPDAEKEEILAPATWTQPLEDPEIE